MFNKKNKCLCGKKIDKKYEFCPFCGRNIHQKIEYEHNKKKEVDSIIKDFEKAFNMPFLMKFPFESLVKKMVKDIDKQFQEYDQELNQNNPRVIKSGVSISVNQGPDGNPVIKVKEFSPGKGMQIQENKEISEKIEKKLPKFQDKDAEKLSKLPKQEPETSVRRLTDRIIYEIVLPGVKNEKNIFINKLQNSIEIRAFSEKQAYFKLIPVSLPIKDWALEEEKLILELKI